VLSAERHGYVIPVKPRRGGCVRGRVLLAGDAAGFADALTGEGISIGIWSGRRAAEALAGAVPDPARYARAVRRELLPELRTARTLSWITYRQPKLARTLLRRRGRAFVERLTDVFLGERTYASLVRKPSSYLSLLRTG
jgi:flavin-dependent dehydrogenase